jgi:hypothetical protein
MNPANAAWCQCIAPSTSGVFTGAAAAPTSNVIDTQGYDYAEFVASIGTASSMFSTASSTGLSPLALWESDATSSATALSSGLQVPGAAFGVSATVAAPTSLYPENQTFPASTVPSTSNDANSLWIINVDLKGRKRYLQLKAGVSTSTSTSLVIAMDALVRLSRADVPPHLPSQMVAGSTNCALGQALQVPAYGPLSGTAPTFQGYTGSATSGAPATGL